jgi:hypothetical protein
MPWLEIGAADIMFFLSDFVWATPSDSVFQKAYSLTFSSSLNTSPVLGVLEPPYLATCPEIGDREEGFFQTMVSKPLRRS